MRQNPGTHHIFTTGPVLPFASPIIIEPVTVVNTTVRPLLYEQYPNVYKYMAKLQAEHLAAGKDVSYTD
jgi:hypothetical protein